MCHRMIEVPGVGSCLLPHEFAIFVGLLDRVETHDASESPRRLHARLAAGATTASITFKLSLPRTASGLRPAAAWRV